LGQLGVDICILGGGLELSGVVSWSNSLLERHQDVIGGIAFEGVDEVGT
jgi:hypothetical protein